MEFEKYQHIERIGTSATEGLLQGEVYVFPKIDGTNCQVWMDDNDILKTGSRKRELTFQNDNAGFLHHISENEFIIRLVDDTKLRLYGEWLVPHTLRTYRQDAWNKFYVFDVIDGNGRFLHYEEYSKILAHYGVEFIPPLCKMTNPSYEDLVKLLDENTYLIQDGKGTGEGIVIKNYDFVNRYGRVTWGKIVRNEFKEHQSEKEVRERKAINGIENVIVDKYVTQALVEKEYSKIDNECGWNSKLIPRLLNTVYYSLVNEESWNFVKEFKKPTVDFKKLLQVTIQKTKEVKPELF
jgi:thiol-disulfide isomerase/thioredoxin